MGRGKSQRSLDLIDAAYAILEEIQPASVRAVCYRLFVAGKITAMTKNQTSRVSKQLVYAREAGRIPWEWVVDETRQVERKPSWADPAAYVQAVSRSYRRNRRAQQFWHVEVWSEKGTVRGTLAPILDEYGVPFRVMHGYGSATVLHDIAAESWRSSQPIIALYVGDWDPSGLHMSEVDLPGRLRRYGGKAKVVRIALTEHDVATRGLPSFSAEDKRKDPRYAAYVRQFGHRCWELDALNPNVLRERVERHIRSLIDWVAWERCSKVEEAERASLLEVVAAWKRAQ